MNHRSRRPTCPRRARYKGLAKGARVAFVTLREYLDKYGSEAKETILLPMDAWNKSCTWGLGGDQVRIMQRKVEGLLLAAEVFDAAASALGQVAGRPAGKRVEGFDDLAEPRRGVVRVCPLAGRATSPRRTDWKTTTIPPGVP